MGMRPLQERRQRAARQYALRVSALLLIIGAVAYSAWFAPWTRPVHEIQIVTAR